MSHRSDARSDRPNLEQKRKLAKELVRSVKQLDRAEAARFTWSHPEFRGKTASCVVRDGVSLAQAQHVIARESGFESWPKLKEYVRVLELDPEGPAAAFEDAVRAIIRGDAASLRKVLANHPEVATMRSQRHHRCYLPHYLAANGVENEHQIVPKNAPEIARIVFEMGADAVVDATSDVYGGGAGSTPLIALVSSGHPHEAGVQPELVRAFCEAGANPNGIEEDGLPLMTALGFRYPAAANALADCGAGIFNLPVAAGLGREDLVESYLQPSLNLVSRDCEFPNPMHEPFSESVAPHPQETMQQAFVFACMGGHIKIAKRLLKHGVDINAGPRSGITALHETCYQGKAEVVHWLVENGASPRIRDRMWNSTAVGWSQGGSHSALMEWFFEWADVDIVDAVELHRYDTVERILRSNSDLANAPDGTGGILRLAVFQGDVEMVKLLLQYDCNLSLTDENGFTALDYAVKAGKEDLKELLISATSQKHKRDNQ